MKVILGLGNPGQMYVKSRHNIGIRCVEQVARTWKIPLARRGKNAVWGDGRVDGEEVALAKSRTFVNMSGKAARALMSRFNSSPQELIIVHDDMDLPLGKVRIRPRGSSAGHKGIISIIQELGTEEFTRVRVGIGRPEEKSMETVPYVLGGFSEEEEEIMKDVISTVTDALKDLLSRSIIWTMNRYNR